MIIDKCKIYWKKGLIPCLVIVGAFIYLLNVSWLRWGSLLIDTGRELYVPWKLLSGGLLYKDIFYEYGPFSPYFNAFLCMIFGVHIRSFIVSGILVTALTCLVLYKISRIFLKIPFATLSIITFLFVFAFGQHYEAGIFNYIIPYSYSATYSILLAFTALFFYYRTLMKEKKIHSYLCSFFIILALVTKVEVGVMLFISIFLGIIFDFKRGYHFKEICKRITAYCLFPVLTAGLIYGLFVIITRDPVNQYMRLILLNLETKSPIIGYMLGTDDFWKNIMIMLKTILYYFSISVVFFTAGWILFLIRKIPLMKKSLISIGIALLIAGITILFQKRFFPYYIQYRCVPIICIVVSVIAYRRYLAGMGKKFLFLTIFSIFSVLLLIRMPFNVWASHHGFYLLVPGMACYYFLFLKIIPEMSSRNQMRAFYRFAFVILSILFIMDHTAISFYMYKNRTMAISSPRGTLRVRPGYYRCKKLLEYLDKRTDPSDFLVIFPEGLTLNFLSARENPMYYYYFLPFLFPGSGFEEKVISDLEENGVTYVVILRRDTSDYGPARFGIDYAQGIMNYLASRYAVEQQFGPWPFTSSEFSLVLLKRTGSFTHPALSQKSKI